MQGLKELAIHLEKQISPDVRGALRPARGGIKYLEIATRIPRSTEIPRAGGGNGAVHTPTQEFEPFAMVSVWSRMRTLAVDRHCYAVSSGSGRPCAVTVPGDRLSTNSTYPPTPPARAQLESWCNSRGEFHPPSYTVRGAPDGVTRGVKFTPRVTPGFDLGACWWSRWISAVSG